MTNLGVRIIKLRNEGKKYVEIMEILGCSKSTISYYCGATTKKNDAARKHDRRNRLVKYMQSVKNYHPCADCGIAYSYYVMQFDHRDPSKKSFTMANAKSRIVSIERLRAEIAKCDIVCANCHAKRTHRRQYGRDLAR